MVDFGGKCIAVGIFDISVLMSGDIEVELVSKPVSFACRLHDLFTIAQCNFRICGQGESAGKCFDFREQLKFCG